MYRTVFWTLWERATVGWFGRMALKHVYYHMWNELPVQVRCMIQGAQGWCTEMTQRDGMGREVEGGFRMGNTRTPTVDSCWCMAKPIQYCKVISLQLKYINLYLKKVRVLSCFKIAKQRAYFRCCLVAKSYLTLLWPHGLYPTRLLHPWDFPGKTIGVVCHFRLQEIFPTQGLNLGLPHCRQTLYRLSHQESPGWVRAS